ncbi:antibiotic biosynthesis monooxygenase [Pistricoccus aurantiacus]|uniref:antibiotic biosynthesis monooxygenase n=1 Tax=Pistricoccus aurantiacus TaxID=1883414 RepID=UPI00363BFFF2
MNESNSVTAVITRCVIPGREQDYRTWVHDVGQVVKQFPGHQGVTYKVPGEGNECHVIFRFDTVEHLQDWEESKERKHWLGKLEGIVEGEPRVDRLTGIEFLFRDQLHPKAHKMVFVLTIVVFLLSLVLGPLFSMLNTALPFVPDWLLLLARVVVQISLLTYVFMPSITRLLATWLAR